MAAPKSNQFWKLRSKHGREKLFSTPKLLLEAAYEYFQWCDQNPWLKNEQLKKPYEHRIGKKKTWVTIAQIPTQRPYTLSGFALYCDASERWLSEFEKGLLAKAAQDDVAPDTNADLKVQLKKEAEDFLRVITHVREIINTQQLEGATVGAFNANIISRKLGLTDKQELDHKGIPPAVKHTVRVEIVEPTDDNDD